MRDMDAIDLYGRGTSAPGGGDRVGRRERAGWAPRPRESLGRIGEGPRSDHVEILSPCVRCMDKRASRRHNSLQTEQGAFGAGTGIIIGRNRERNRDRVRFRHNCPNPPFGRETHVDGAWLDPDAFGRAARAPLRVGRETAGAYPEGTFLFEEGVAPRGKRGLAVASRLEIRCSTSRKGLRAPD